MVNFPLLLVGKSLQYTRVVLRAIILMHLENASNQFRRISAFFDEDNEEGLLAEVSSATGFLSQSVSDAVLRTQGAVDCVQRIRVTGQAKREEVSNLRALLNYLEWGEDEAAAALLSTRRNDLEQKLREQAPDDKTWKILCDVYGAENARIMLWGEIEFLDLCIRLLSVSGK